MLPTDDFSIAFHIGAHKTATSHLQRSLREASDCLADAGVRYYGPTYFRLPGRSIQRLFGLVPLKETDQRRSPQDQLALMRKDGHRLVLSEENYTGVLNSPRRREVKMRYPYAAHRMNALAQAMDIEGLEVFLGIRHPARYLNSAYGQQLLGGRLMTFERYRKINPLSSVNWLSLAKRLNRAKGIKRLTVWRYEDYVPLFPRICAAMVGCDAANLVKPLPRRIHVGLSADAVHEVHQSDNKLPLNRQANFARKHFPVSDQHPAFDGFTLGEYAAADVAYDNQTTGIKALSGVTFLTP